MPGPVGFFLAQALEVWRPLPWTIHGKTALSVACAAANGKAWYARRTVQNCCRSPARRPPPLGPQTRAVWAHKPAGGRASGLCSISGDAAVLRVQLARPSCAFFYHGFFPVRRASAPLRKRIRRILKPKRMEADQSESLGAIYFTHGIPIPNDDR